MAGGGGKQGSFGGIGTSISYGGVESSGYRSLGSSHSKQEEYPKPAASSHAGAIARDSSRSKQEEYPKLVASSHADAIPRASRRGDHVVNDGLENAGSSAGHYERRPSGSRGRGGRNAMDSIEALGQCIHRAADYDLEMKSDGFVLVKDLLKLSKKTAVGVPLSAHSEDDVRKAIAADGKQCFGLKEESEKLFIKANQGHSIKTVDSEQLLMLITSPSQIPVYVHGTYERFMSSIWQEGLKRMEHNHVHFATGLPQEDGVMSDRMKLYISANNVVLTEGMDGVVPTRYFKRVVKKLLDNKEIPLFPPTH